MIPRYAAQRVQKTCNPQSVVMPIDRLASHFHLQQTTNLFYKVVLGMKRIYTIARSTHRWRLWNLCLFRLFRRSWFWLGGGQECLVSLSQVVRPRNDQEV